MSTENRADPISYTLFGDPVYDTKGKRGRPPFRRTEENANKVMMLLAAGWSNRRIASCILDPRTGKSISEPTLKRYFRSELALRDEARDQLKAKQLMVAAEAAFDGNVGAMRLLEQLMEKNDAMLASLRLKAGGAEPKRDVQAPRLGKKEQALKKAEEVVSGEADTAWGDDLKPGYEN
ncbi:resolvase [Aestuariibius sp. 2305UL40-4]|uniref:resolvase n=1 Tax=Aestuariibius violaceus TaxID=3234132 RepID=UPI00345EBEB6